MKRKNTSKKLTHDELKDVGRQMLLDRGFDISEIKEDIDYFVDGSGELVEKYPMASAEILLSKQDFGVNVVRRNKMSEEIDIWTGRKIAEILGFREHPREGGLYLRNRYSDDFEGDPDEVDYILCYHTGAPTDRCIVSLTIGDTCVGENEIIRTHDRYQRLKTFIELRNDREKAIRFLKNQSEEVDK